MALKRTVTLEAGEMPVQKRLKRVEAQVKRNRPEMKMSTTLFSGAVPITGGTNNLLVANITQIAHGDFVSQRAGNKVRVWRVEVRGTCPPEIDAYLLQAHNGVAPTNSSFNTETIAASFVDSSKSNVTHTEWAFRQSRDDSDNKIRIVRKFKGMELSYDGASITATRNNLYLVFRNPTTSTLVVSGYTRVWFTDV